MPQGQAPESAANTSSSASPPHPFDMRWHVHVEGKTYGPYSGHQIRKMVEQNKIVESDYVYPERNGDSAWQQIVDDPILGALFKTVDERRSSTTPRAKAARRFRKWLFAVPVVGVIAWIAWPYYAAYELAVAVREGDVSILESRVAWDSVRQGLRGDLNAVLLQKLSADAKTDRTDGAAFGAGLAAVFGPAIIDRMIENYVTPQAVANRSRGIKSSSNSDSVSTLEEESARAAHSIRLSQIKYAFFTGGPLTFRVDVVPDHEPPLRNSVEFYFQWTGNWKLTRIMVPPGVIEGFSEAAENPDGLSASKLSTGKRQFQKSPNAQPPLRIALVEKGFEPSNFRAGNYQDYITFHFAITNDMDKDIRAFDGVVTFTDLLDNEILSMKIAVNQLYRVGAVDSWQGTLDYNQFMSEHRRLKNEDQQNLKVRFSTRRILFADGTSRDF